MKQKKLSKTITSLSTSLVIFATVTSVVTMTSLSYAEEQAGKLTSNTRPETTVEKKRQAEINEQPLIVIKNNDEKVKNQAIELQDVQIETSITGRQLKSKVTLTLHNPNDRVLEGELILPLADGQKITGFSLDIHDEMRPAVPVEKAKGQQVFEDTIRQRVDPALLEKTIGNDYRLRVYPLPVKGERKIELHIEQELSAKVNTTTDLPIKWLKEAKSVKHLLSVVGWEKNHITVNTDDTKVVSSEQGKRLIYDLSKARQNAKISLSSSGKQKLMAIKQNHQKQSYLYAEIPTELITQALSASSFTSQPKIKKLTLVWDSSLSGLQRDTKKEISTLMTYLKQLNNVDIELFKVSNGITKPETFTIKNGNVTAIKKTLENISYDGSSVFNDWQLPNDSDAIFVFTDGLETMQDMSNGDILPFSTDSQTSKPITKKQMVKFISSSITADKLKLAEWARVSQGSVVNLNSLNTKQAVKALTHRYLTINKISSENLKEINLASVDFAHDEVLYVSGKLKNKKANTGDLNITVSVVTADKKIVNKKLSIPMNQITDDDSVATKWANMHIDHLSADANKNKNTIIQLGKDYNRITDFTSLIVLDTVQDYVTHRIEPPRSLVKEYNRLIAAADTQEKTEEKLYLESIIKRQQVVNKWWNTKYPTKKMSEIKDKHTHTRESLMPAAPVNDESILVDRANISTDMEQVSLEEDKISEISKKSKKSTNTTSTTSTTNSSISTSIKAWSSEKPYIKALQSSFKIGNVQTAYQEYLSQRNEYMSSPSFYLDVAEFFFNENQKEVGLKVLSNLAEISKDNRQLLRILAYRLSQAKQYQHAIIVLEKIKRLAPNEPQSWRDLGLAYADAEQWQKATDNLWHVVSTPWDRRFSDISLIALNELNAIVTNHSNSDGTNTKNAIDSSKYNKKLLKNLPVGMRVVLSWDTDNSDMDLWVTDPNGEKVFYSHKLSNLGGRISQDFTGGYGPEEFMLKKPIKGKYQVHANFYGTGSQKISTQTTLQLNFFENFGTEKVKEQRVMLMLKPHDENVLVGEFTVD